MPTVLELYPDLNNIGLPEAAQLLTLAKSAGSLDEGQLKQLAGLVNNSLVGASKLLHFVAPTHFAIWDSRVYSFVHEECPYHYRVNKVPKYLEYLNCLSGLCADPRFREFHSSVNAKVGYTVESFRALELIMFLRAPVYGG